MIPVILKITSLKGNKDTIYGDSDKSLMASLLNAISISDSKLVEMKNYCCNSTIFDISNYTSTFRSFLKNLMINN